ncbi:MAG: NADH-quinone oxidoreductase subunit C, partial [Solirubrobacteraceae bacterium]|nr:NADH-quinone oxidoreductase subunit C [Solirubrobacteraceae bacterium]
MSIQRCAPDGWRDSVQAMLDGGGRFAGAWAAGHDGPRSWSAAFTGAGGELSALVCRTDTGAVPTIVDLVPAADWDEREAHDLYGLRFDGHDPLRALAAHPADPAAWMTPVQGAGVHDVAVGPIHAGVIESGHFRFHVVGERILALDPRLFYKHRGLERAAHGRTIDEGIAYAQRACGGCAVTNTVAYAQAVEETRGLWPDHHTRIGRTLLLELERLYNHLNDISAICAGVGFALGTMAFAALKDRAQQLNRHLTGHRFLFGTVDVGASRLALDRAATERAREALRDLRADAATAWRTLEFAGPLQARLDGVGVLGPADAARLGACGPAARASGLAADARTASPRLAYESFVPATPRRPSGDVAARLDLRAAELQATWDILDGLLIAPIAPGTATRTSAPVPLGLSLVESPRGATLAVAETNADRLARLHLRTGSYANWPALARATAG